MKAVKWGVQQGQHILSSGSSRVAEYLQWCARTKQLNHGKLLHAQLLRSSDSGPSLFLLNHLLNMYSKCGSLSYAYHLFDQIPQPNLVSWTALISGLSQNLLPLPALSTFSRMLSSSSLLPNHFALSSAVQAASSFRSPTPGSQLHSLALKLGLHLHLFVASTLADMYSKCGALPLALKVFDEMPHRDEVAWNALIDGHAKNGAFREALLAFCNMRHDRIPADPHILCSALSACGGTRERDFGRCLHSLAVKLGLESDVFLGNALTDMYAKARDVESAALVMGAGGEHVNVVSCSSLIDGFVEVGDIGAALRAFMGLLKRGIEPNEFTYSSLIKACANKAALEQGSQLHAQVIKMQFYHDPFVYSILIDMYGKCGLLGSSSKIFEGVCNPTEIAWNAMLGVFAQHGRGKDALMIFDDMVVGGKRPNGITFVNLLMACSHSGLVQEGLDYFDSMERIYKIEPQQEHYSCVIDLLGRAGRIKEAKEFVAKMPFEPNAFGWCSLLGACRTHGDREMGAIAAEKLMELEPENSGTHILLSNIYASAGQWEEVKNVRKMMRYKNVKKLPGYSWVDAGNKTHVFGAEDWSHPQKKEIYEKLEEILDAIRKVGYVPYTGAIACNLEESEKERLLYHHSERIAVAFALISLPKGKPIIVKKNLRICLDCHSALKYLSKVVGREIIVRDNARFHHFEDGFCSCGDYW